MLPRSLSKNKAFSEVMTERPFEPRDEPTGWDLLLLFVFPTVILVAVFVYPNSTQILEYKARNPTTLTILGSNLAHRGLRHIAGNLLGLWLIGGVGFVFACLCQRKRLYYYSFASYLSILPFFADPFIRSLLEDAPEILATFESVGFSQTVGALVGFLALATGLFVHENLDRHISGLLISAGLFFSGFTIVFVNFGTDSLALTVSIASGLTAIGYVLWRVNRTIEQPLHQDEGVRFVVAALFIFYATLLLLFPNDVGGGFYGHLAGYMWGYLLPASGVFVSNTYNQISEKVGAISSARP